MCGWAGTSPHHLTFRCVPGEKEANLTYGTITIKRWEMAFPARVPLATSVHRYVPGSTFSHRLRPPHSEHLVGFKYSQAGPKAKRYLINLPLHQRYHFDGYSQEASSTCDKYPAVPCWALTHTLLHRSDEIFEQTKKESSVLFLFSALAQGWIATWPKQDGRHLGTKRLMPVYPTIGGNSLA